jgi:hypothetical protein
MSAEVIYTASDLDRKRREVTDAARRGVARIRDTDGMALVLLPARHYEVLDAVSRWHDRLDVAERARAKPSSGRVPRDFGDLTWLRHFDDGDLATFISEVRAAVSVAYHDDDLTELDQLVRDWRTTADELADPARRHVLLGAFAEDDFVEADGQRTLRDRQRIPAVHARTSPRRPSGRQAALPSPGAPQVR